MNKKTKKPRYKTIEYKGVKGIRFDQKANTYYVEKYIRSERFNATFNSAKEAADWKKNWHPNLSLKSLDDCKIKKKVKDKVKKMGEQLKHRKGIKRINGNDFGYTFSDAWKMYHEMKLSKLERSSYEYVKKEAKSFDLIMDARMVEIDGDFISDFLSARKEICKLDPQNKRYSFRHPLKVLNAFFNWYRGKIDSLFVNPITKVHRNEDAFVKKMPKKKKKMKKHELLKFFQALEKDSIFWRDFAETQFYFSGRVQEVGGLQKPSVDFEDDTIEIENVAVYGNLKKFMYLKDRPKNGENRTVYMNNKLREIMQRRIADISETPCNFFDETSGERLDFVFHIDGQPLDYRAIQYRYDKALRKAKLAHKYSATHIMRHTMANLVRSQMDVEHAQAVGGWKSRDLVENVYTEMPTHLSKKALNEIEKLMDVETKNQNTKEVFKTKLKLVQ